MGATCSAKPVAMQKARSAHMPADTSAGAVLTGMVTELATPHAHDDRLIQLGRNCGVYADWTELTPSPWPVGTGWSMLGDGCKSAASKEM